MPKTIVEDNIDILVAALALVVPVLLSKPLLGQGQEDRYRRKSQHRPFRRCGPGSVRDQLLHGHPLW